jgi:FixJ family two-component response regulator
MSIQSKEGCGTEFTLSFPIAATPNWILEKLLLRTGDTVVILDDDDSVHQIWEMRFADYMDKINLVHFKSGREAQNFIASFKEKDKIILLSDYKLNNQDINGADVIDQSGLCDKSTLVTNSYNDRSVILNNLSPINKILPKSLISEVEIIVKDANNEAEESSSKQLVVIVDDNRQFTDSMIAFFENHRNVRVDAYSDAKLFLKNISKYSKDTKIIMDHDFKDNMNGFDLAAQLYEWGYTRLYMVSGKRFEKKEIPHYLTVLLKHPNSFEVIVDAV